MRQLNLMLLIIVVLGFAPRFAIAEREEEEFPQQEVVIGEETKGPIKEGLPPKEKKIARKKVEEDKRAREKAIRQKRKTEAMREAEERREEAEMQRRRHMQEERRRREHAAQFDRLPLDFNFRFPFDKLTVDQRRRVELIRLKLEQERIRKEAEIRVKEIDLRIEMIKLERIEMIKLERNRQQIEAIIKEVGNLRTEIQLAEVGAMFDAFGVLTPDQRREAREVMEGRPPRQMPERDEDREPLRDY
jgi:dTMP kinase